MPFNIEQQQQPLATASLNTANMATTTYPFTYTTFTNTAPQPFTKPTVFPTGIFSFGPVMSCASNSATASPTASAVPVDMVQGTGAGCVISNAQEVSNHAFWDLYDCCKSRNITAIGKPFPCSAQCLASNGQTWQDLGKCLSQRNAIVVCKPDNSEIGSVVSSAASASASKAASSGGVAGSGTSAGGAASATGGAAQPSKQSAGASSLDVTHATVSKAGLFVFGLVALTSAAGMFL